MYVEGEDDVLFWHSVLSEFSTLNLEILPVYSSTELDKRIEKIINEEVVGLAGRDADYLRFDDRIPTDPRLLVTAGHSIENCLFINRTIFQIVKSWCKNFKTTLTDCTQWLDEMAVSFRDLLVLEIANYLQGAGVSIMGDNCSKFMQSQTSSTVCKVKITNKLGAASIRLDTQSIKRANQLCPNDIFGILTSIRGHFLESAVHKFVSEKIKASGQKGGVSYDALYAHAIQQFEGQLKTEHPAREYYMKSVQELVKWLKNN